jgi:tetratricopeptide (TPR) repeat protein
MSKLTESEFAITRTQGLVGLRVKREPLLSGGYTLNVIHFVEPCMVSQLGYLEIGDEILSIDGKLVRSDSDIIINTEQIDTDLIRIKFRRHNYHQESEKLKRFGLRYFNQLELVEKLKSTLRSDHIDLAEATLQLGIISSEIGDFTTASSYIEEALNNAYGTSAGVNKIVGLCYSAQAHISYKSKKYLDARRHLWEAVELFKKIGASVQIDLFQTYQRLLSVAEAQDSAEDREFTKKKSDDLQQLIMAALVSSLLSLSPLSLSLSLLYLSSYLSLSSLPPHCSLLT